jgi:putative Mg2+ transporter-C (MgtC) family protein|tara:strand:+ start:391 stop:1080 length:690 start_codon:yes stop_codon:yes gene_type:complete
MEDVLVPAGYRLFAAAAAGGMIGLERAYHGRPAGFRTHILVCMASSLLMVLVQYQWLMVPAEHMDSVRIDPSRMAQGIMTGIGFLGAGVIIQERHIVRGLTTAASIWITSAIGIIIGAGFFWIGALAGLITLGTLSLFRVVESNMPARHYARLGIVLSNIGDNPEKILLQQIESEGLQCSNIAYYLKNDSDTLEINLTVSTFNNHIFNRLSHKFKDHTAIKSFSVRPLE